MSATLARDGFFLFRSSLAPEFFVRMRLELAPHGEELAHDALASLASVATLLDDPVIRRATAGATRDPCCHLHLNNRPEPGDPHEDDYDGGPWPYPCLILCVFPQDTPPEMGPTEVKRRGEWVPAAGPAGTCLLMRHTMTHRSGANLTGQRRDMLKVLYRLAA